MQKRWSFLRPSVIGAIILPLFLYVLPLMTYVNNGSTSYIESFIGMTFWTMEATTYFVLGNRIFPILFLAVVGYILGYLIDWIIYKLSSKK